MVTGEWVVVGWVARLLVDWWDMDELLGGEVVRSIGGLWESRWVSGWLPMDIFVDGLSGLVDIRVIVREGGVVGE